MDKIIRFRLYKKIIEKKNSDTYKNYEYSDIIDFCDRNDIDLTLVVVPMPDFITAGVVNYDEYIGLINSIIEGTDVDFYDFNLCREIYFPNYVEHLPVGMILQ